MRWWHGIPVGLAMMVVGCAGGRPPLPPPPAKEVTIALPLERSLADHVEYTGRTDAIFTVDVRARVSGYLTKVNFKDGSYVKTGDVLYEIDQRPYIAQLNRSKGEVARAEGEKQLCDIQVQRYTRLVSKGAASQQDLDEWVGRQAANVGSLAAAKAQVAYDQLNVDFCTLTSPIDGMISRTLIQIGNLVNADTTTLTTIVSVNPIYVYFSMDEPTYLRIVRLIRSGELASPAKDKSSVPVGVGLADDVDRKFPLKGTFDFVNNQLDKLTATITIRAQLDNPFDLAKGQPPLLRPGLFVRVRVPLRNAQPRLLVPEQAIGTDQGFKFVWLLDKDNKAHQQRVTLGQVIDGMQVVTAGIDAQSRVVVKGLQRCRVDEVMTPTLLPIADLMPGGMPPALQAPSSTAKK